MHWQCKVLRFILPISASGSQAWSKRTKNICTKGKFFSSWRARDSLNSCHSIQEFLAMLLRFFTGTVTLVLEIANRSIRDVTFTWDSKANGYRDVTFCYNFDGYSTVLIVLLSRSRVTVTIGSISDRLTRNALQLTPELGSNLDELLTWPSSAVRWMYIAILYSTLL